MLLSSVHEMLLKLEKFVDMKTGIGEWRIIKEGGEEMLLPPGEYEKKTNELNKIPIYKKQQ